ncbi:hypothetical protein ACKLNR_007537 [Fusarium oxysporum f. sp. zingiberi]
MDRFIFESHTECPLQSRLVSLGRKKDRRAEFTYDCGRQRCEYLHEAMDVWSATFNRWNLFRALDPKEACTETSMQDKTGITSRACILPFPGPDWAENCSTPDPAVLLRYPNGPGIESSISQHGRQVFPLRDHLQNTIPAS